jgi:cobalamin biosynthesis Co2+ chelatase CbiK
MSKPRIVIRVEGGLIQWITADVPMEVLILDHDIMETDDTDNIRKIVEPNGSQEEIYSQGIGDVDYVDPADVDLYFNQFKEERRE